VLFRGGRRAVGAAVIANKIVNHWEPGYTPPPTLPQAAAAHSSPAITENDRRAARCDNENAVTLRPDVRRRPSCRPEPEHCHNPQGGSRGEQQERDAPAGAISDDDGQPDR